MLKVKAPSVPLLLALAFTLLAQTAWSEDLLAEDDFSFESTETVEAESTWLDATRFTLQQSITQGRQLELLRSEARMEYEDAPWEGGYLKLDQRAYYFAHKDRQARQQNTDYGHYQIKELWLQQTQDACFAKLGRQNVFWGSVEGTFAVDVLAPFDYTEPLFTDFSSVRRSQDLLLSECFWGAHQWQAVILPRARLDQLQHRQEGEWKDLESSLNEEWGLRYIHQQEGLDIHVMIARLYGNTPVVVLKPVQAAFPAPFPLLIPELEVPRFNMAGLTVVKAIERLLLEMDLAYKEDQLEAHSGKKKNWWDLSAGFEYTTASNHAFNGGVWWYPAQAMSPGDSMQRARAWTAGWNNTYFNDDLTLSFLGTYFSRPRQRSATFQAEYQWDDYWAFSSALSYTDLAEESPLATSGWQVSLQAKWQI